MENVKLLETDLPIDLIYDEVIKIYDKIQEIKSKKPAQISLQSYTQNDDWKTAYNCSIGKIKQLDRSEEDFVYPIFDVPVINGYIEKYNLYRTRIMVMTPKTTLTWHQDYTPRIHIPVKTNNSSFVIVENISYHLEAGKSYWVNTTLHHTAINCNVVENRLHIVGCVRQS